MPMCFMISFAEYLINEAARMLNRSVSKGYFGNEIIRAHLVEEFTKLVALMHFWS